MSTTYIVLAGHSVLHPASIVSIARAAEDKANGDSFIHIRWWTSMALRATPRLFLARKTLELQTWPWLRFS